MTPEKVRPIAWGIPNSRPTEKHPRMSVTLDMGPRKYPELLVPLIPQRLNIELPSGDVLRIPAEEEITGGVYCITPASVELLVRSLMDCEPALFNSVVKRVSVERVIFD